MGWLFDGRGGREGFGLPVEDRPDEVGERSGAIPADSDAAGGVIGKFGMGGKVGSGEGVEVTGASGGFNGEGKGGELAGGSDWTLSWSDFGSAGWLEGESGEEGGLGLI